MSDDTNAIIISTTSILMASHEFQEMLESIPKGIEVIVVDSDNFTTDLLAVGITAQIDTLGKHPEGSAREITEECLPLEIFAEPELSTLRNTSEKVHPRHNNGARITGFRR